MKKWQIQTAKNKFSEVIDASVSDGPQVITKHGKEVAVIISYEEFLDNEIRQTPLSKFLQDSPLTGLTIERDKSLPRKLDALSS